MKREEDLHRYCFSQTEGSVEETPSEQLYRLLLPQLPHYMIALLKILLAAAPHSKAKTDVNIHILADLLTQPQGQESSDLEKNLLVTIDMARHKEVIVKVYTVAWQVCRPLLISLLGCSGCIGNSLVDAKTLQAEPRLSV